MNYKELKFNIDARSELKKGIDELANAVKITLGAKGRYVVIEKQHGLPQITKDGVTVAKEIELEDKFKNLGAQIIKGVAAKTNDDANDGTTTATILTQAIIHVGLKNVTAGANPIDIKRGIDKAVKIVVESIKNQSQEIGDSYSKLKQIASISANNDFEIGKLIADAINVSGIDGVIKVEEAKGTEDEIKSVDGMKFDKGYLSPRFITDSKKMEAVLENPYILLINKKISAMNDIVHLLDHVHKQGRSLLIIAEDVEGEMFGSLIMNKVRGTLNVAAVKAPSFGDERMEIFEDIAILTSGDVISDEKGMTLIESGITSLGSCDKVIINKTTTTIIGGHGCQEDIKFRVSELKSRIENESEPQKIKLQNRLAKLTGGIAIIYVGASSEIELKEKRDRVDDALGATRAAIEEGFVPGGGVTYIRAIEEINNVLIENADEYTGISIIKEAIEYPLRQIVENAGIESSIVVEKIKKGKTDYGYNVHTEKYEKFFKTGIIDPAKVTRVAIENAASVAGMFLTTECAIIISDNEYNGGI